MVIFADDDRVAFVHPATTGSTRLCRHGCDPAAGRSNRG
jgi:hypothetical protein